MSLTGCSRCSAPVDDTACDGTTTACPLATRFHLHLDANRDGTVDDDRTGLDSWTWGAGGKGAIILCNCDDDGGRRPNLDNDDGTVNGAGDVSDLAPLVIRRDGIAPPADWEAFLEVDAAAANRIRIFSTRAAGGTVIIGPGVGHRHQLPNLNFTEREFGMEGTLYPNAAFNGEIAIRFELHRGTHGTDTEAGVVRVAPWMLYHHLNPTVATYVVQTADNGTFLTALDAAATAAGLAAPTRASGRYARDRWMQDAMEPGFTSLPKTGGPANAWNLPAILRTANDRDSPLLDWGPTDQYPRSELLAADLGFLQALPPMVGSSLDSFGNLECSPPITHAGHGREYKFGRIVFGTDGARNMQQEVRDLLAAQRVQAPFSVDTSWLIVGHVDEVFSFCPFKTAPKGFKVLIASPRRALAIIQAQRTAGHGAARLFQGIHYLPHYTLTKRQTDYPLETANAIWGNAAFRTVQTTVQGHIDTMQGRLRTELDLADTDFIELPVLFKEDGGRHIAYTPGVVNSLVLTKPDRSVMYCMPKPFGPVVSTRCQFEVAIEAALGPAATTGVSIRFIDDFCTYHVLSGEIHCGTNSMRKPPTDRWWWQQTV